MILSHRKHNDINFLLQHSLCVSLCLFSTHSTVIWILPSISFTVYLLIVPGYEFPSTQCPRIQIFFSMSFHMTLYVATGDESFATHSTVIWIFPSIFFICHVLWFVVCCCTYPNSFVWLGIMPIYSTFSMLHCLLPSSHFSLSFSFLLNPDCNDLTAEIIMVLSYAYEVHTITVLHLFMLCQPLFRRVFPVALLTIKKLNYCQSLKFWSFTFDNNS